MQDSIKTYSIHEIYENKLKYTSPPINFNFKLTDEELSHYNKTYNIISEDNKEDSWRVNQNQFTLTYHQPENFTHIILKIEIVLYLFY